MATVGVIGLRHFSSFTTNKARLEVVGDTAVYKSTLYLLTYLLTTVYNRLDLFVTSSAICDTMTVEYFMTVEPHRIFNTLFLLHSPAPKAR